MSCQCEVCLRLKALKARGVPEDVLDYLIDLEVDRDYYKAIVKGEGPGAIEILERTLRRLRDD